MQGVMLGLRVSERCRKVVAHGLEMIVYLGIANVEFERNLHLGINPVRVAGRTPSFGFSRRENAEKMTVIVFPQLLKPRGDTQFVEKFAVIMRVAAVLGEMLAGFCTRSRTGDKLDVLNTANELDVLNVANELNERTHHEVGVHEVRVHERGVHGVNVHKKGDCVYEVGVLHDGRRGVGHRVRAEVEVKWIGK